MKIVKKSFSKINEPLQDQLQEADFSKISSPMSLVDFLLTSLNRYKNIISPEKMNNILVLSEINEVDDVKIFQAES